MAMLRWRTPMSRVAALRGETSPAVLASATRAWTRRLKGNTRATDMWVGRSGGGTRAGVEIQQGNIAGAIRLWELPQPQCFADATQSQHTSDMPLDSPPISSQW